MESGNAPEKISMLSAQKIIPETIITRSKKKLKDFIKYRESRYKPLYMAGESIFLLIKR